VLTDRVHVSHSVELWLHAVVDDRDARGPSPTTTSLTMAALLTLLLALLLATLPPPSAA
jgi:hypothetical protein